MTRAEAITKLDNQVKRAHRRLTAQRFVVVLGWSLFTMWLVAMIAIAVPKIWSMSVDPRVWNWSWVGGATLAGLTFALLWTRWTRANALQAAIEVDQRFQLKERVSSCFALNETDFEGPGGQALLADAVRRVERIDVESEFPIRANWRTALPLVPAVLVFLLITFLPDAQREKEVRAAQQKLDAKKQISRSTENLRKRTLKAKKKADELGLKKAQGAFDKLTRGLDDLKDVNDGDLRKAFRKLSDLSDELQKRRQQLGSADKMKEQFSQLKNLRAGPADKFAKAMQNGDFAKAVTALNRLKEQMLQGDLSEEDQKKLAEQLQLMSDKLKQMSEAHRQAKKDLQSKIENAKQRGDMDQVNRLQKKLDQLNRQDRQMSNLEQMANKLGQCSDCMAKGMGKGKGKGKGQSDMQAAVAQLDQLAEQLDQLNQENGELEMLDEALDQISMAKNSMNCKQCNGMGCQACMGGMNGLDGIPGMGMGEGQGKGPRPEERTDSNFYDSRVKAKPGRGQGVIVGEVRGRNVPGDTRIEINDEIAEFKNSSGDPLTGKRLPKAQREHVRQYIRSLQSGD